MKTIERPRRRQAGRSALQTDLVHQILRGIADDGAQVGAPIRELPLAQRFGVSRTPVRAALRMLEQIGYLAFDAGRGFTLARPVDADAAAAVGALPRSDTDELHRAIMADRARGLLPAEVSEAALMPRYGVSRGMVRRVLMQLSDDGLARRQRGHGWRFTEALDSHEAVMESYRFRIVIECAALAEPGYAADRPALARLREQHQAILRDPENLDPKRWFEANNGFHETVALWSHNRFLIEAVRRQNALRRFSEHYVFHRLSPQRIIQSSREHLAILDAIEKDDRPWAASLLERHLALAARSYEEREAREAAARERANRPVSGPAAENRPIADPPASAGRSGPR